jgi:hypothetical protein
MNTLGQKKKSYNPIKLPGLSDDNFDIIQHKKATPKKEKA